MGDNGGRKVFPYPTLFSCQQPPTHSTRVRQARGNVFHSVGEFSFEGAVKVSHRLHARNGPPQCGPFSSGGGWRELNCRSLPNLMDSSRDFAFRVDGRRRRNPHSDSLVTFFVLLTRGARHEPFVILARSVIDGEFEGERETNSKYSKCPLPLSMSMTRCPSPLSFPRHRRRVSPVFDVLGVRRCVDGEEEKRGSCSPRRRHD